MKHCASFWNSAQVVNYSSMLLTAVDSLRKLPVLISISLSLDLSISTLTTFPTEISSLRIFYSIANLIWRLLISDSLLSWKERMEMDFWRLALVLKATWHLKFMPKHLTLDLQLISLLLRLFCSLCMQALLLSLRLIPKTPTINYFALTDTTPSGRHILRTKDRRISSPKISWTSWTPSSLKMPSKDSLLLKLRATLGTTDQLLPWIRLDNNS